MLEQSKCSPWKDVPRTGVIYVMERARALGYTPEDFSWTNFGRGSPEVGVLPDSPPRLGQLPAPTVSHHYSPVAGLLQLRQKVAEFYNYVYRRECKSQYTYENVSICSGGRLALTRIAACIGSVNLGHFIPDYTAYEELLNQFKDFTSIPINLDSARGYWLSSEELAKQIDRFGLGALLLSNPCNPTGKVIAGQNLADWLSVARSSGCAMIFDEFYSHYVYDSQLSADLGMISAANFVKNVNEDPVIIIDGLTKNWRYPGWRIAWTLGPKDVIERINSAGSFVDGGPNHPVQLACLDLLDPARVNMERLAIQKHFRAKRDWLVKQLSNIGLKINNVPEATFYLWVDLSSLPEPLRDCMFFFEECLREKVIVVPGVFFDVNPGQRRTNERLKNFVRISYGPALAELKAGVMSLKRVVDRYKI